MAIMLCVIESVEMRGTISRSSVAGRRNRDLLMGREGEAALEIVIAG